MNRPGRIPTRTGNRMLDYQFAVEGGAWPGVCLQAFPPDSVAWKL